MSAPPRLTRPMTAANLLSVARILVVPIFVALLFSPGPEARLAAVLVFALAVATDALDGYLARSQSQVTKLGQFLDPLADKIVISAALLALNALGSLPLWVSLVIIGREVAVTGVRVALQRQGRSLPASALGKLKTAAQAAAIIAFMLPVDGLIAWPFMVVALILTLYSGAAYGLALRNPSLPGLPGKTPESIL